MKMKMISLVTVTLTFVLMALMAQPVDAAQSIRIKLQDGSIWRGELNTVVVVVYKRGYGELNFTGKLVKVEKSYIRLKGKKEKTILRSDLVSIRSLDGTDPPVADASAATADVARPDIRPDLKPAKGKPNRGGLDSYGSNEVPHVFLLPLSGMVGTYFRHVEMEMIGKEADKYGPHQIIILEIDSGGGSVLAMERIHITLTELAKRHRLVAWVKHATSAACATAIHCEEIYFMTEGLAGAMTAFGGGVAVQGEELQDWLDRASRWMEQGGREGMIARTMIKKEYQLSYTKDPVTGEVTWFDDLSGDVILSNSDQNLEFNSSAAVDSGFAQGIADTTDELAALLDLPAWPEDVSYGRGISEKWHRTVKKCEEDVPLLLQRLSYYKQSDPDPVVRLGAQLSIWKKLRGWCVRADFAMILISNLDKDICDQQIEALKRQIAKLRRN